VNNRTNEVWELFSRAWKNSEVLWDVGVHRRCILRDHINEDVVLV